MVISYVRGRHKGLLGVPGSAFSTSLSAAGPNADATAGLLEWNGNGQREEVAIRIVHHDIAAM